MASKITVAELLVSIGLDSREAEKASKRLEQKLGKLNKTTGNTKKRTEESEKALKRWKETADKAGKVASGLAKILKGAGAALLVIGTGVIKTGSDFETLSARLKTVTGSAEKADAALSFVKDFAKDTPFQVAEITDAFIKLRNLGIEPTERRLTAFGNIAAGNSKSLDQFTEAVLDASAGEFERLKEFGIRAKQNGDKVALTFRGVTKSIGNNAAEITDFLTDLGENDFAGAMQERMGTLEGVISNAKDAFTNFLLEIAQDGPLQEFKELIGDLVNATGDKEGLAKILSRTLTRAIRGLRRLLQSDFIRVLKLAASALEFVVENWTVFIGLIAGAKTIQAFATAGQAFERLGLAVSGTLGIIGQIAGVVIAMLPFLNKLGDKLGDILVKQAQVTDKPRTVRRGGNSVLGRLSKGDREALAAKDVDIAAAQSLVESKDSELRARGQILKAESNIAKVRALTTERANLNAAAGKRAAAVAARANQAATAKAEQDARDAAADAAEEEELAGIVVGPEFIPSAFAGGGGGGGGGRRKKKDKKKKGPTSIDTVAGFFRAAQAGDVGAIAARTPSTKEIEPTVAIDITNNNFTFENKISVKSSAPAGEVAREVAIAIKTEFQGRLRAAGQQIANNVVR